MTFFTTGTDPVLVDSIRDHLVMVRHYAALGTGSVLRRAAANGELTRIASGVYLPSRVWTGLNPDERYLAVIHAAAARYPREVFTHRSAAALWRLPIVGAWPTLAESSVEHAPGGRSRTGLVRRAVGVPRGVVEIDGVRVSDLARTVVDCAAVSPFATGVAFADRALQQTGREDLEAALVSVSPTGAVRARRVVSFADGASESAGESLSRTVIEMLGFERPDLQVEVVDAAGLAGRVDFSWGTEIVGEFDGHGKYVREAWTHGRSAADVVLDEKRREDRIRATGRMMVRWGWEDARSPRVLERRLAAAGVSRRQS